MSEFVMVPVPVHRVTDVYRLLADESPVRIVAESGEGAPSEDSSHWSPELIERAYRESPPPMKAIFEVLSESPDEQFGADVLSTRIQRTRQQMAGVLGAFGRRAKNRYRRNSWPFHADWDGAKGMVIYRMDADVAATLRRYRDRV